MKNIKTLIFLLVFIINFLSLNTFFTFASNNENEKLDILFISSFDSNFISIDDQVSGLKSGLNNNANILIEYMNARTFNSIENEENFYNLIKYSLENYPEIDAVIAADDDATEFCIKYQNDLFNTIPIVFLAVQKFEVMDNAYKCDLISGVFETESLRVNIELIKKLHPNVDTITFLDTYQKLDYADIIAEYPELNFKWILTKDKTLSEVQSELSELNKTHDAVIRLYIEEFKDIATFNRFEMNSLLAESCFDIPIYNVLNYDVGQGSIGGKVINHFNQGKEAGSILLKLLNGVNSHELFTFDDSTNEYYFDYNILNKFDIKLSDLPDNSIIINHPMEIIKRYKNIIITSIVLFISLIGMIVVLLWYIIYKKRYEKAILTAMHNAEEASKIKTHFISNISHELKTPINVIMSAIQLINYNNKDNSNCSKKHLNSLNIIDDNCRRLLRLLSNLIDLQKHELNDTKLNLSPVNIVNLIENLLNSVTPYADSKNLTLIFDTNREDVFLEIDIDKIERVILNLLSNAIKFSKPNGKIKLTLKFTDFFYIIVEDDGIGIAEKDLAHIFDKFTQIDTSFSRKNEGSGIGLSIVKSFINLHQGKIFVDSKINKGTVFLLQLPLTEIPDILIEDTPQDNSLENVKTELSDIYI